MRCSTIEGLKTHFFLDEGVVRAVDGVDLRLPLGKTVCVVGESGCGKSVTARSILGLVEPPGRVVDGRSGGCWQRAVGAVAGTTPSRSGTEVVGVGPTCRGGGPERPSSTSPDSTYAVRGCAGSAATRSAMVFQEPMASLSPMYTVGEPDVGGDPLHQPVSKEEARERGVELLRRVGIPQARADGMDAYPFQLSGGMCQRVMIAIALSCEPRLLIADEPTTALDVTTQARIIDLLEDLQADTGHGDDVHHPRPGVVAEIADEVVVMYLGTVVEQGAVDDIFHDPKHPVHQGAAGLHPDARHEASGSAALDSGSGAAPAGPTGRLPVPPSLRRGDPGPVRQAIRRRRGLGRGPRRPLRACTSASLLDERRTATRPGVRWRGRRPIARPGCGD